MAVRQEIPVKGQCSCGEIRYESTTEPLFCLMCQCRQCQRITGTGHATQIGLAGETTIIQGNVSTYALKSDAGNDVVSAFCGNCGNPVFKTTSMAPDVIMFHAATLDDPSIYQSQMVVCSEFAQPWDYIDPDLPRKN